MMSTVQQPIPRRKETNNKSRELRQGKSEYHRIQFKESQVVEDRGIIPPGNDTPAEIRRIIYRDTYTIE